MKLQGVGCSGNSIKSSLSSILFLVFFSFIFLITCKCCSGFMLIFINFHLLIWKPLSRFRLRLITRSVNRIWFGWALLTSSFAQTLHNSHLLPQPFLSRSDEICHIKRHFLFPAKSLPVWLFGCLPGWIAFSGLLFALVWALLQFILQI